MTQPTSSQPTTETETQGAASHSKDEAFLRKVTERVWQLWRADLRREAQRRGDYFRR